MMKCYLNAKTDTTLSNYHPLCVYHPPQTKHKVKGGQFLGASLKSAQAEAPLPFEINHALYCYTLNSQRHVVSSVTSSSTSIHPRSLPKKTFPHAQPNLNDKIRTKADQQRLSSSPRYHGAPHTLPHNRTPKCHCTTETFRRIYVDLFNQFPYCSHTLPCSL